MRRFSLFLFLAGIGAEGCSPATGSSDAGPPDAGGAVDAGGSTDAGGTVDAGGGSDAGCPDAGFDTWCNWANGFFATYCDSCHVPGQPGDQPPKNLDFTVYAIVHSNSAEIRCGVANGQDPAWACGAFPPPAQFPINPGIKPSDPERGRLVAWIDAGAPQ
jgi:hypothetical protein